jgi:hypothetical protein
MEPHGLAGHALQPRPSGGRAGGRGKNSLGSGPASQDDSRPIEAPLPRYGGEAGRASAAPGPPGRMVKKLSSLTVLRMLKCQKLPHFIITRSFLQRDCTGTVSPT